MGTITGWQYFLTLHFQRPMGMYVVTHLREIISVVRKICDKLSGKRATLVERTASLKATIKQMWLCCQITVLYIVTLIVTLAEGKQKKTLPIFPQSVFCISLDMTTAVL